MRFKLSEEDRKHYGLSDEWIHFDRARFTNREATLVEAAFGLSPRDWFEALMGVPLERDGVPVLYEDTGEPIRRPTDQTIAAMLWLGMRRAGHDIAWQDWEYDLVGVQLRRDDQPDDLDATADEQVAQAAAEGDPGKDEASGSPPTPS